MTCWLQRQGYWRPLEAHARGVRPRQSLHVKILSQRGAAGWAPEPDSRFNWLRSRLVGLQREIEAHREQAIQRRDVDQLELHQRHLELGRVVLEQLGQLIAQV
jgi:hypothetical protein